MIINTGIRTDIPAFYAKWFINRLEDGYVYVRNPYYPKQIIKYDLNPNVVDCIDFCTKNPKPMLKYLDKLKEYNTLWYVTITPYGKDIETNVPDKDEVIESFKELVKKQKNSFVGWRYDPIFFNKDFNIKRHIAEFNYIATKLKGYTKVCVISFLDIYEKVEKNASDLIVPTEEERIIIAKEFYKIALKNGMKIYTCCENDNLAKYGLICSGCKSEEIITQSISYKIMPPKIKPLRTGCNCLMGSDIGAYDSCYHLCRYCYANTSKMNVLKNIKNHYDDSPLLIGRVEKDDKIVKSKQQSYIAKEEQLSLF